MPVTADVFRQLLGRFATGVAVLTCLDAAGEPSGMTVSAVSSVSLDPPLLLVCVGRDAAMIRNLERGATFGLSVLAEDQLDLSEHFARRTDFDDAPRALSERGVPVLPGAIAQIECERTDLAEGGDHVVIFGTVLSGAVSDRPPLIYYRGQYGSVRSAPRA